jgi:ribosome-binding factor A
MSERTQRMSEVIRRELSRLMTREVGLEGLLITIASVETAPDMKNAYVYVSMIEQRLGKERLIGLLNKFRGEWQRELGKRISSKFTPRLHFQFDDALERGDRVMELMQEIERQKEVEASLPKSEDPAGGPAGGLTAS